MCFDATQGILYTVIICINSVYSLASLFLPKVFEDKKIEGFYVGIVFSMYSIACVVISPIIGKIIKRVGFANLVAIGLVMMGISIAPIGYLKNIESKNTTLLLAILLRALQGVASAAINTSCYSLAANKYKDNTEFIVGMLEASAGIGLIIGLLGGSAVYKFRGYSAVFITFGTILEVMAFISISLFVYLERRERREAEGR